MADLSSDKSEPTFEESEGSSLPLLPDAGPAAAGTWEVRCRVARGPATLKGRGLGQGCSRRAAYLGAGLVLATVALATVVGHRPLLAVMPRGGAGVSGIVALAGNRVARVVQTSQETSDRLASKPDVVLGPDFDSDGAVVDIDVAAVDQEILGFGGAFTEAAATAFSSLSPEIQDSVIDKYFGADGLGYTLGRVHINSCDFSVSSYSFDDVEGDLSLENFDTSLAHDMEKLIPLIRRAKEKVEGTSQGLRLLASPWSPPAWMKTSNQMSGTGDPCLKDEAHGPWANYISKWISSYTAAGLPIWAMTAQNEPSNRPGWEACTVNAQEATDFVGDFLGPTLEKDHPDVKLFIVDDQKHFLPDYVNAAVNLPKAWQYVDGAAFHWYTGDFFDRVADMHKQHPELMLLASEATYERSMWLPGMTAPYADWRFGEGYAHDIIGDLNAGSVGWIDWNLLLDDAGGPNHVGNVCDAAIIAHADGNLVDVHPQYYFIGHFSKFLVPGSKHLSSAVKSPKKYKPSRDPGPYGSCTGADGLEATAARRPDGQLVVVVLNCAAEDIEFKLKAGQDAARVKAPRRSITTFIFPSV